MKNQCSLFFLLLLFSQAVLSYELDGSITPLGNGTYSVHAANEDGHQFSGNAVDQGDGSILVTVTDKNGVTYRGLATDFSDGDYQVEYRNQSTGDVVTGTLSQEHH